MKDGTDQDFRGAVKGMLDINCQNGLYRAQFVEVVKENLCGVGCGYTLPTAELSVVHVGGY